MNLWPEPSELDWPVPQLVTSAISLSLCHPVFAMRRKLHAAHVLCLSLSPLVTPLQVLGFHHERIVTLRDTQSVEVPTCPGLPPTLPSQQTT